MKTEILEQILRAQEARQAIALVTTIATGEQRIVPHGATEKDVLADILHKSFRFDRSGVHTIDDVEYFITIYNPPLRLVIIGAVLIAQAVIPMARAAGYDVTVIDPRGAFATGTRFPNVALISDWPEDVLPAMKMDARTAILLLTHDPKIDDPGLELALRSSVFYVGALGSKKTHGGRVLRLTTRGFSTEDIARINGPIGLNIGAVGAAEIAISIMAQMTKTLRLGA